MNDWNDSTFAELAEIAQTRRVEAWERAAFVASYAFNSNPYLRRPVEVPNPARAKQTETVVKKDDFLKVFPDAKEAAPS